MKSSFPISPPRNHLELPKTLPDYPDKKIGKTALNQFSGQLCYLSEKLVSLAFFNQEASDDMKRRMVAALDKDRNLNPPKCGLRDVVLNNCLTDFVTKTTCHFLKIKSNQKKEDPGSWNVQPGYLIARKLVQGIQVTNNTADQRGNLFKNTTGF